jgi:hypothetical protein
LTVAGKMVFLAGRETIDAVGIIDPHHPKTLGSQKLPVIEARENKPRWSYNVHDLIYRDGYLYVSCQSDDGLMILQVNDERVLDLANDVGRLSHRPVRQRGLARQAYVP